MRTIEQYFLTTSNVSATLASGTASTEITLNYQHSKSSSSEPFYKAPPNGEATLAILLTTTSGTASCTVSAKNLYGDDIEEESYWSVETVSATTSGVNSVNILHITNSTNYDPNASGIKIKIARSESVDVTYKGRLLRA